ncbi:hypothetical protein IWX49DRAFT_398251 [Phyllosticta citricarpa]
MSTHDALRRSFSNSSSPNEGYRPQMTSPRWHHFPESVAHGVWRLCAFKTLTWTRESDFADAPAVRQRMRFAAAKRLKTGPQRANSQQVGSPASASTFDGLVDLHRSAEGGTMIVTWFCRKDALLRDTCRNRNSTLIVTSTLAVCQELYASSGDQGQKSDVCLAACHFFPASDVMGTKNSRAPVSCLFTEPRSDEQRRHIRRLLSLLHRSLQ